MLIELANMHTSEVGTFLYPKVYLECISLFFAESKPCRSSGPRGGGEGPFGAKNAKMLREIFLTRFKLVSSRLADRFKRRTFSLDFITKLEIWGLLTQFGLSQFVSVGSHSSAKNQSCPF